MKYEATHSKGPQTYPSETSNAEMEDEEQNDRVEITAEILESSSAQDILPYLTLDKLDERIEADLFTLSSEVIDAMQRGLLPKDKFTSVTTIENIVAEISGETDSWRNGPITPKLAQARKLFCATLLNSMGDDNSPTKKWGIYNSFFGISPGLDSYCGGLQGSLELLMIAKRTNNNPFTDELCDEIIYDSSFSEINGFKEVFERSEPIKQLRLLPVFNSLALRCDPGGWSSGALDKITELLGDTKTNPGTTPLVKLVTESVEQNISDWFNSEWIDIDMDNTKHAEMIAKHEKKVEDSKREQERLHDKFPNLPIDRFLIKIAPGFAAALNDDTVDMISNNKGEVASLLKYQQDNPFGLNRDMAFLIGAAHNHGISELISAKLGMKLEDVPFGAQRHLLKYMTGADNERFDRLCDTLQAVDKKLRLKLTEGFIAADFGEDFGDALLSIAGSERLSNKEKEDFFDTVNSCRESIRKITELYSGVDNGQFMREYARAANERLTDATMVFDQIAKKGVAEADLDWAGVPKFDYESAMEALRYEAKSLEIISGTLRDVKSGVKGAFAEVVLPRDESLQRLNRTFYNFYSPQHGYVLLYTRPEGSHSFDPTIEFGKERSKYSEDSINAGVEASISLTTNPIDPFSLPNPYRPDKHAVKNPRFYDPIKMDKVSAIRLDREGRAPGMAANDSSRDPINPVGMVSVDLAAIGDRADTPSGKIARLLSVGGKLREEASGVDSSLNHNTRWFDQDSYGTADGFRDLVGYVDKMALKWCSESKPGREVESFTRKMKQKLGKTARRVA